MRALHVLTLGALLSACIGTGTEIGNPSQKDKTTVAQVGLTAFSSDPMAVSLPLPEGMGQDGTVMIFEAWVSVHELELVTADDCAGGATRKLHLVDLVGDLAQGPLLSKLDVPITGYCKVEVSIEKPEDSAPANPLGENTLRITGQRSDGTPFTIESSREFGMELRSRSSAFTIDKANSALLVAFDVQRWFQGVALDAADVSGNHILIDDHHNTALLQAFEDSVRASLGVYRDHDDDGRIEDDEREAVAGGTDD